MEPSSDNPPPPPTEGEGQQRSFFTDLLAQYAPVEWGFGYDDPNAEYEDVACVPADFEEPQPQYRISFRGKSRLTSVHGYPSTGGVYMLSADRVELEFLGVDPFQELMRSDDPAEEDAFCNKMRMLGAVFWESMHAWFTEQVFGDAIRGGKSKFEPEVVTGWPAAGGVWVIKTTEDKPVGVGRVNNALDMEERCRVIKQLGGQFYENPKDCPHLDLA